MKLRQLAKILETSVPHPVEPDRRLEQYRTQPELALRMVLELVSRSKNCRTVVDFGCGTGMLSYATSLVEPSYVIGVDIDYSQLVEAKGSPLYSMVLVDFVNADVRSPPLRPNRHRYCVIENPPFGVWRKGADAEFLEAASKLRAEVIVSLHKYNARSLEVISKLLNSKGYRVECLCRDEIIIPAMYETHRRRVYRVEVAIIAAVRSSGDGGAE